MDLRFREELIIVLSNIIELGRVIVMVGPFLVWPVTTMILNDKITKKENRS